MYTYTLITILYNSYYVIVTCTAFEDLLGNLEHWRYFIGKIMLIRNIFRKKIFRKNDSQPLKYIGTMTPDINYTLEELTRF